MCGSAPDIDVPPPPPEPPRLPNVTNRRQQATSDRGGVFSRTLLTRDFNVPSQSLLGSG